MNISVDVKNVSKCCINNKYTQPVCEYEYCNFLIIIILLHLYEIISLRNTSSNEINFVYLAKLPKWFGERPGKKAGDPETPEGEEDIKVEEDEIEEEEVMLIVSLAYFQFEKCPFLFVFDLNKLTY